MVTKEVFVLNRIRQIFTVTLLLSLLLSFNGFAMINNEFEPVTPATEEKQDNDSRDFNRWVWINDGECVQFNASEDTKLASIKKKNEVAPLLHWVEFVNGSYQRKVRDTFSGKWTQAANGIWSFTFDDCTIPVGVTKIDGVMYAFNTYGELKEGYEYYPGIKTEADGLAKADNVEFVQWIETQYLPECTEK